MTQLTPNLWWGFNLVIPGVVFTCEFTCAWSVENFIARLHIYPGLTSKVSTLAHFQLEPGCEDYSFLGQAVENLGMIRILFSQPLSTHENWMHPLMKLVPYLIKFLCLVSTVYDTSRLQLAPSLKSCMLWCQARVLLCFSCRQVKCQLLSYFVTFLVIQLHLHSGLLCHQIMSLWILPIRGLIRVFLTFRLTMVQLLRPL